MGGRHGRTGGDRPQRTDGGGQQQDDGDDLEECADGEGGPGIEDEDQGAGGGGGERAGPGVSVVPADCVRPWKAGAHTAWLVPDVVAQNSCTASVAARTLLSPQSWPGAQQGHLGDGADREAHDGRGADADPGGDPRREQRTGHTAAPRCP
ncbi:hypothetical protein SHO565_56180 [Streptomyces sp. HO565]